ncbi:TPA: hypothetical protein DCZ31_04995 [Patescibacteria group bacterium]|nr:hypothetical protein [Candidatus Gracilibacteria bacterium]
MSSNFVVRLTIVQFSCFLLVRLQTFTSFFSSTSDISNAFSHCFFVFIDNFAFSNSCKNLRD